MVGDRWVKMLPHLKGRPGVTVRARGRLYVNAALDERLGNPDTLSVFVAGRKIGLTPGGEFNVCRTRNGRAVYALAAVREAGLHVGDYLELTDIDDGIHVLEKTAKRG